MDRDRMIDVVSEILASPLLEGPSMGAFHDPQAREDAAQIIVSKMLERGVIVLE